MQGCPSEIVSGMDVYFDYFGQVVKHTQVSICGSIEECRPSLSLLDVSLVLLPAISLMHEFDEKKLAFSSCYDEGCLTSIILHITVRLLKSLVKVVKNLLRSVFSANMQHCVSCGP